ncbi:hypothetical protein APSETT444_001352 [Aspergillus pseudonomiae]
MDKATSDIEGITQDKRQGELLWLVVKHIQELPKFGMIEMQQPNNVEVRHGVRIWDNLKVLHPEKGRFRVAMLIQLSEKVSGKPAASQSCHAALMSLDNLSFDAGLLK